MMRMIMMTMMVLPVVVLSVLALVVLFWEKLGTPKGHPKHL